MHPLVEDIRRGTFDDVIDELHRATKERIDSKRLGLHGLAIGDKCNFTYQTSPKYLNTHGVEILRMKDNGEIIVKPLAPGRGGRLFRVRHTSLEKAAA